MKKNLFAVSVASILLAAVAAVGELQAQGTAAKPAAPKIVVIDVNEIFKSYSRFKQRMEQLNTEVQNADAKLKQEFEQIRKLSEGLADIRKESPDYRRVEEDITKKQSEFTASRQIQQKDFVEKRARLYYDTYVEIQQELKYFTGQFGIDLVVQHNSEEVDTSDWQAVVRKMGGPVVFHNNLDITKQILDRLNQRAGAGTDAISRNPRQGVAPTQRQ